MKTMPIPFPLIEKMDDDHSIVACLLNNESDVTEQFLYGKCGSWFVFLFRYYNPFHNCENAVELADDAYVDVITPRDSDNTSKLQRFDFSKKLHLWFFRCSRNMCITRCRKHRKVKFCSADELDYYLKDESLVPVPVDTKVVEDVINHMSNKRYAEILRHRYIEDLDIDKTAETMGETKAQCSRVIYKAKEQFEDVLRRRYPAFCRERDKNE